VSVRESGRLKFFSDLSISQRIGWKSRNSRTKEIDDMGLLAQWLLFVLGGGEEGPLETAPASGG
jgi:hypothetical protein